MLRETRQRIGARLRRVGHRRGGDGIIIDELVSPLRYDLVVREQFFDFIERHRQLAVESADEFLNVARSEPYFEWFRSIAFERFHARPGHAGDDVLTSFRTRVQKSVALFLQFEERGFDERHPVQVRIVPEGARLSSGKLVGGRYYPSDGCHRLALLRRSGTRILSPDRYRIRPGPFPSYDHTAVLLPALDLDPADYYRFLSRGYADGAGLTRNQILERVAAQRPDRLAELESVLGVDERALARRELGRARPVDQSEPTT